MKDRFAEKDHLSDEKVYRFQRLTQMFWALEISLLALIIAQLINTDSFLIAQGLTILFASFAFVYILIKRGKTNAAASALFTMLMVTVSILMWRYGGLRDEAILAYPALLIFASVLGNRRLFAGLATYAILSIAIIAMANSMGWRVDVVQENHLQGAINLIIILALIIFSAWLLSDDLSKVFARLSEENRRVKDSETKIQRLLHHDSLTNLPNRILARERFLHALSLSKRNSTLVGLMFLDLDNFKVINDSFGHQFGDRVLVEISTRLRSVLRESDCVSRQGGDEFLVIVGSLKAEEQIANIALKLLETIREPILLDDTSLIVTASIGITVAPNDGEDFDAICKSSDIAMYKAKERGRNAFRFFSTGMDQQAQQNLRLLSDMRTAVANREFELHYQPKIDLHTNTVVSAEALIRWDHPTHGRIPPADFIPLAERSGVIVEISNWVIREACKECRRWHEQGFPQMSVAVNVSPVQFKRGDMAQHVEQALAESGLPPSHLEFELTESMLIDDSTTVKETLTNLRQSGVELSIDDFGTGYSNLAYLKRFDVSTLKIDQSFIGNVNNSSQDLALVKAIVQMSSSLNLKTVAEGVETAQVASVIRELNCDIGQGYYWSKPLPADEFIEYIRTTTPTSSQ